MTKAFKRIQYPQEEIQRRFEEWAALPATDYVHFKLRDKAWHAYCDARDGVPEGFSQEHYDRGLRPSHDARQMEMFNRRVKQ